MARYYSDKKKTVEECLTLTTKHLKNELTRAMEIDHHGLIQSGTLSWGKNQVRYETERHSVACYIRLQYVRSDVFTGQKNNVDLSIKMSHTIPHYGGYRWWFICPLKGCERRVAKLHKPPLAAYFGCRHCHNLTYQSTRETTYMDKADRRLRAIYERLGGTGNYLRGLPEKPQTMRSSTYFRLLGEYMNLQYIRDLAFGQQALKGMRSLLKELGGRWESASEGEVRNLWERYKANPYAPLFDYFDDVEFDEEDEEEEIDWEAMNYGTLGEIARLARVPYEFAKEAQAHDLIRPDKGRGKRKKRYRHKLATWLEKLHILNQAGYSWDDLKAWSKRRFKEGHEHEAKYPAGFKELEQ